MAEQAAQALASTGPVTRGPVIADQHIKESLADRSHNCLRLLLLILSVVPVDIVGCRPSLWALQCRLQTLQHAACTPYGPTGFGSSDLVVVIQS
jgi:hypothetical protein